MSGTATDAAGAAAEAARLLQGTPGPTGLARLRTLERDLAAAGDHDRARTVRAGRRAADSALAIAVCRGRQIPRAEMLALAKRMAEYKELGYARRVTKLARQYASRTDDREIYTELFQKSALYTYKDPDLPVEWRLDRALEILAQAEDLAATTDPETLGLAGAIYKRKWEVDAQRQSLERSLSYYLKGYAQGAPDGERGDVLGYLRRAAGVRLDASRDRGYCGVNAAFLLDLLAKEEVEEARRLGLVSATATARRADARLIREEVLRSVPPLADVAGNEWLRREWWFYATIGEACFGVERFDEATEWLTTRPRRAGLRLGFDLSAPAGFDVPEWEYESTARQLARLARLQSDHTPSDEALERSAAGAALRTFLAGDEAAVDSTLRGKVGLGLSGGGFRAALFHIGTLASLAEYDLLRHVEVLSCVSGGSIIGAHYYLKVRELLETRCDAHVTRDDYVRIVREIENEFLAGVQRNIRTRVLAELSTNLKMMFWPGYSRTLRVGELYEREIFARIARPVARGGTCTHPGCGATVAPPRAAASDATGWFLHDLFIHPCGQHDAFHPRSHNWRRHHKVPTLVLNAACLNTGHNWQFTASYMGEPPTPIDTAIDASERLRRMYYREAPRPHRAVRLGHAVAASSCVPGLFEPLVLDDLYPDRSVRLVDGGVCDNQGIASLLEQDCTVLLVSDGSGQMGSDPVPSGSAIGVPLRANTILQARVRETQYGDISARRRAWLLRGLLFVHLTQDLPGPAVAWKDCPADRAESDFERRGAARDRTSYGVALSTQRRLAAVRTDLDSFSDAEAYALMASAYRMTDAVLGSRATPEATERSPRAIVAAAAEPARGDWRFRRIDPHLEPGGDGNALLERLLAASSAIAFKVWSLSPPLVWTRRLLAAAALAGAVGAVLLWPDASLLPRRLVDWVAAALTPRALALTLAAAFGLGVLTRVLVAALGRSGGTVALRLARPRETLRRVVVGAGMSLCGFLLARLHLHLFDRLYLRLGSAKRFPPRS